MFQWPTKVSSEKTYLDFYKELTLAFRDPWPKNVFLSQYLFIAILCAKMSRVNKALTKRNVKECINPIDANLSPRWPTSLSSKRYFSLIKWRSPFPQTFAVCLSPEIFYYYKNQGSLAAAHLTYAIRRGTGSWEVILQKKFSVKLLK